jgi:IS30 family transposase
LSSSRRVKKGPGRRPLSAKRQQFMRLRERGWSIRGAGREIGISRTTANNWSRGYKIYRRGQLVGFMPALERLAVRQISPRFLSQDERIEPADLRHAGLSIRQIACRLGRAPSTISRELRRNATTTGVYRPFDAHRHATARRARHHRRRLEAIPTLGLMVAELLSQRWSPQQSKVARTHEVRVDDLAWRDPTTDASSSGRTRSGTSAPTGGRRGIRKESLLYFRAVLKHLCAWSNLESWL